MVRNRVLSFVSQFSSNSRSPATPASSPPATSPTSPNFKSASTEPFPDHHIGANPPPTPPPYPEGNGQALNDSAQNSPQQRQRSNSRPLSAYQPPLMDVSEDTIPELQPVFAFLNSHSNKLYQEGYFLKLDDQNTHGRPNQDRTWTECFAQLVGTVLSLWDAAELDAAGEDGEVLPKFINLTDASIKMIESLPTRSKDEQPLQNILSISTAGRNRYLLHFNSHHSLVQWTAGIRLAMYEHATLQEAYTGALIAGKGKSLNNINVIMERARLEVGEWVRVRFGAGVPWRRCWCVITPPDEKEYAKQQKELKKKSAYDRSAPPALKGDIKFYDTKKEGKKQKKLQPIASITDAYAAYAIYPQAKSLVDASTLLKIEGNVSIHTDPPSATEGFVFVMPEVHPMVSGFEMLMRYLFPTWDTFALYGRPGRLVASTLDQRSLMFAMPKHKRYGYLEILDITTLINEKGSAGWTEKEWRRRLKEMTGTRMNAIEEGGGRSASRNSQTFASGRPKVGFADEQVATRSSRSFSLNGGVRTDSAPPDGEGNWQQPSMAAAQAQHARNSSDPNLGGQRPGMGNDGRPPYQGAGPRGPGGHSPGPNPGYAGAPPNMGGSRNMNTPEPVSRPPAFNHGPQERSVNKAYHSPELRRANSRLSSSTLAQMAGAGGLNRSKEAELDGQPVARNGEQAGAPVHSNAPPAGGPYANSDPSRQALNVPSNRPGNQPPHDQRSRSPYGPPSPSMQGPNSRPQTAEGRQSPFPPGGGPPGGPQGRGQPNQRPPPGGPPGPHGRPGPGPRPDNHPHRKPIPMRGGPPGPPGGPPGRRGPPPTADDIIDSYSSEARQAPRGPGGPPGGPPPPPHGNYDGERPRAGVLKTVAGGEPAMQPKSNFDIPDVNFGPTVNYGASGRRPVPGQGGPPGPPGPGGPGGPGQSRPYTPDMRLNTARSPPASPYYEDGSKKTMAWQPGAAAGGSGGQGQALSPEQYVQRRAAPSPQFGDGRAPSPGYGGGQAPGSFSRPMRSPQSNEYPPQGQYGQGRGGNPPQQYQGQAL